MLRDPIVTTFALVALTWGTVVAGTIENTDTSPNLHCSQTQWYSILFFFITNYAIHVATVISLPGESRYASAAYKACCLLIPFAGIRRGVNIFLRASALSRSSLHGAARANALCMIVRSESWRPRDGDVIEGCEFTMKEPKKAGRKGYLEGNQSIVHRQSWRPRRGKVAAECHPDATVELQKDPEIKGVESIEKETDMTTTQRTEIESIDALWNIKAPYEHRAPTTWLSKVADFALRSYRFRAMPLEYQTFERQDIEVHGVCELPPGYALCFIPPHMDVRPRGTSSHKAKLSSNSNALQVMWALAQTIFGSYTLWQARGSQLSKYGYAAFGLTVIPYVIASIINLLGSLVHKQYDDVYLVHSDIMDEAVERGAVFDGVVGTICPHPGFNEANLGDDEHGRLGEAAFQFSGDPDDDGTQTGWRVDSSSTHANDTQIQLNIPRTGKPKPSLGPGCRKWRSCWNSLWAPVHSILPFNGYFERKRLAKRLRKSKTPTPILSVPSHGQFRRLPPTWFELPFKVLAVILLIVSISGPYIIIYLLTGFKPRNASSNQRSFSIIWLVLGQTYGLVVTEFERNMGNYPWGIIFLFVLCVYGSAAVSGMVVVVQEMLEFGTCKS